MRLVFSPSPWYVSLRKDGSSSSFLLHLLRDEDEASYASVPLLRDFLVRAFSERRGIPSELTPFAEDISAAFRDQDFLRDCSERFYVAGREAVRLGVMDDLKRCLRWVSRDDLLAKVDEATVLGIMES